MESGINAARKRELTFGGGPFMFFGRALYAVARVGGISVRRRNEMTNFIGTRGQQSKDARFKIDDLSNFKFMCHQIFHSRRLARLLGIEHHTWGRFRLLP